MYPGHGGPTMPTRTITRLLPRPSGVPSVARKRQYAGVTWDMRNVIRGGPGNKKNDRSATYESLHLSHRHPREKGRGYGPTVGAGGHYRAPMNGTPSPHGPPLDPHASHPVVPRETPGCPPATRGPGGARARSKSRARLPRDHRVVGYPGRSPTSPPSYGLPHVVADYPIQSQTIPSRSDLNCSVAVVTGPGPTPPPPARGRRESLGRGL